MGQERSRIILDWSCSFFYCIYFNFLYFHTWTCTGPSDPCDPYPYQWESRTRTWGFDPIWGWGRVNQISPTGTPWASLLREDPWISQWMSDSHLDKIWSCPPGCDPKLDKNHWILQKSIIWFPDKTWGPTRVWSGFRFKKLSQVWVEHSDDHRKSAGFSYLWLDEVVATNFVNFLS